MRAVLHCASNISKFALCSPCPLVVPKFTHRALDNLQLETERLLIAANSHHKANGKLQVSITAPHRPNRSSTSPVFRAFPRSSTMPLFSRLSLSPTFKANSAQPNSTSSRSGHEDLFESHITTRNGTDQLLMSLPLYESSLTLGKRKRPSSSPQSGAKAEIEGPAQYQDVQATLTASRCYDEDASPIAISSIEDVHAEILLSGMVRDLDTGVHVQVSPGLRDELSGELLGEWIVVGDMEQGKSEMEIAAVAEGKSGGVQKEGDEKSIGEWEGWWKEMAGDECVGERGKYAVAQVQQVREVEVEPRQGDEKSVEDWEGWWRMMAEKGGL